jgi:hypothetical protein
MSEYKTDMEICNAIEHLPEYKNVIRFLNNETMDQCIHKLDQSWINKDRIKAKAYKIAELMGIIN